MLIHRPLKFLLLAVSPLLVVGVDDKGESRINEFLNEVREVEQASQESSNLRSNKRDLFVNKVFGSPSQDNGFGQRCGRRNQCAEGLECVFTGVGWKLCLPMTCIQQVADDFSKPPEGKDTTLFEDFVGNVLAGAGLSPTLFQDHRQNELANENATNLKTDELMNHDNLVHFIKEDVQAAMRESAAYEETKDTMAPLKNSVKECVQPHLANRTGGRDLQFMEGSMMADGFWAEIAAAGQFFWSMVSYNDTDRGEAFQVDDFCGGGGLAAGVGGGYVLQLWFITEPMPPGGEPSTPVGPKQSTRWTDSPALMVDVDVAVGPGFGLAYNTVVDLEQRIDRLFLKFGGGAGAGVTLSGCGVRITDLNG